MQNLRICVFGDSVTYAGYVKNSWYSLLKTYLEEKLEDGVEIFNLGINGNTTTDLLKRFANEAEVRSPDKIVFAIGINDSGFYLKSDQPITEISQFKQNLIDLINQAKKFTNDIIFIEPVLGDDSLLRPYPESSKGKSYDKKRTLEYNAVLEQVALENDCDLIELFDSLEYTDFMDGLHPNDTGHKKMFDIIKLGLSY